MFQQSEFEARSDRVAGIATLDCIFMFLLYLAFNFLNDRFEIFIAFIVTYIIVLIRWKFVEEWANDVFKAGLEQGARSARRGSA